MYDLMNENMKQVAGPVSVMLKQTSCLFYGLFTAMLGIALSQETSLALDGYSWVRAKFLECLMY